MDWYKERDVNMKRVLTIQDISCLGKCSLTIALPVISAMGVETVILPTAVLSTHTMFKNVAVKDLSDHIQPVVNHWKRENIEFDAIYTGYLGTIEEIELMKDIFRDFKKDGSFVFVDPVMADHGKLYSAFNDAYVKKNAELCASADIIVPNITEAAFMTGTEYREEYGEDYVKLLLKRLNELGAKVSILTGVSLEKGKTGVYGYIREKDEYFNYQNDCVLASYHGTGDLFASVAVGSLVRGKSLYEAFRIAADYTALTISETLKNPRKPWYGVDFESTIPKLIELSK